MKKFLISFILVLSSTAFAQDFCSNVKNVSIEMSKDLPAQLDSITRLDQVTVFCSSKFINFYKTVTEIKSTEILDDFIRIRTKEFSSIYCANSSWRDAINDGWKISEVITFDKDHQVLAITAKCN